MYPNAEAGIAIVLMIWAGLVAVDLARYLRKRFAKDDYLLCFHIQRIEHGEFAGAGGYGAAKLHPAEKSSAPVVVSAQFLVKHTPEVGDIFAITRTAEVKILKS